MKTGHLLVFQAGNPGQKMARNHLLFFDDEVNAFEFSHALDKNWFAEPEKNRTSFSANSLIVAPPDSQS
jgi:hypothetical protein